MSLTREKIDAGKFSGVRRPSVGNGLPPHTASRFLLIEKRLLAVGRRTPARVKPALTLASAGTATFLSHF